MKHDDADRFDVYICAKCGNAEVTKKGVPPKPCITCAGDDHIKTTLSRSQLREILHQGQFEKVVESYLTSEQLEKMRATRASIPGDGITWRHEQPQMPPQAQETYTPTCPTCHSPDIAKIRSVDRAGSVFLFGIFSSKINKQFECKNCGYKW